MATSWRLPSRPSATRAGQRSIEGGAVDAKEDGGILDGVAVLVDEAASVLDSLRGESRPQRKLHAPRLGRYAAGPGASDDRV